MRVDHFARISAQTLARGRGGSKLQGFSPGDRAGACAYNSRHFSPHFFRGGQLFGNSEQLEEVGRHGKGAEKRRCRLADFSRNALKTVRKRRFRRCRLLCRFPCRLLGRSAGKGEAPARGAERGGLHGRNELTQGTDYLMRRCRAIQGTPQPAQRPKSDQRKSPQEKSETCGLAAAPCRVGCSSRAEHIGRRCHRPCGRFSLWFLPWAQNKCRVEIASAKQ